MPCMGRVGRGKLQKRAHFPSVVSGSFNGCGGRGVGTKKARSWDRAQMTNTNELPPGVSPTFQASYSVPPFTLSTFSTAVFARFFVALLELQSSEKAVILYLLFQDFHGPFNIIIDDSYFQATKLPQIYLPFLCITGFVGKRCKPGC